MNEQANEYSDQLQQLVTDYTPTVISGAISLVGAIIVLLVGLWVIKRITRGVRKLMEKKEVDPSLIPFLTSLVNFGLKAMLVITVIGMLGVEMTSFIAILGAAGLAVGLALQGSLSNFAGGVMILIFKPFRVGDFIQGAGHSGSVKEIQVFNTILKTPDNVTIIIPNGSLSNTSITNYSKEEQRRVDWTFGIAYGDNVDEAYKVLEKLISEDERILKDPESFMAVAELADSSVNIVTRVWVKAEDYWGVKLDMLKSVYEAFDKAGLSIPYPQMDVHVQKEG